MIRRHRKADPVTPELRRFILHRDRVCFLSRVDLSHICRDTWGMPHRSDDTNRLTIEHVHDGYGMAGKRAPSDPAHLLALCGLANVSVPSKERRAAMRSYLAAVVPNESLRCDCGHFHLASIGDDGADSGCEEDACPCWDWHQTTAVAER